MKYVIQFVIILTISLLGELLNRIIPLPVPASIYGMAILFTALCTGAIKLPQVKETGMFLISILPIMFVPAAVGLLDSWGVMQGFLTAVISVTIASTITVIAASGIITQLIIKRKGKEEQR